MSWNFEAIDLSPAEAKAKLEEDQQPIPEGVVAAVNALLDFHDEQGSQKLNVKTHGHFPFAGERVGSGSIHSANLEVIVTLGKNGT